MVLAGKRLVDCGSVASTASGGNMAAPGTRNYRLRVGLPLLQFIRLRLRRTLLPLTYAGAAVYSRASHGWAPRGYSPRQWSKHTS
jgi:hypothetical protein